MRGGLIVACLCMLSHFACAATTITDVKFYNLLDKAKPPGVALGETIGRNKLQRLYARFTIIGTDDTIRQLEENGHLSVVAEWALNGRVIDVVEVGISQERWEVAEDEFRRQIQTNGSFAFRTLSYRTYIPIGTYRLTIRDRGTNILAPEAYRGRGIYQPSIEVTE